MTILDYLWQIVTNGILLSGLSAWVIAQVLKTITYLIVNKKFQLERLFGDGGMPSGHSATVTSLAIMCGLTAGFDSPLFGLATIFAIVVMHDALGVRREAGKHAISIIEMAEMLNDLVTEKNERIKTDKLKIFVGHTPWQVVCGSALGAVIAIFYHLVFVVFS